ncbi:MAG: hypothetical protein QM687_06230 [Ferruginibacter sp.]
MPAENKLTIAEQFNTSLLLIFLLTKTKNMYTKKQIILILSAVMLILSCNNLKEEPNKTPAATPSQLQKINPDMKFKDTLSNDPQFKFAIADKQFYITADKISNRVNSRDSSITIEVKGVEDGYMIVTIPSFNKCPGSFATGYRSVYLKKFESEELGIQPTVDLYGYPVLGMSLKNSNDGFHEIDLLPGALIVNSVSPVAESNGKKFILKGEIHTTVLKNVYESHAGEANKDYKITGQFSILVEL